MIKKIFIIILLFFIAACGPYWYKPYGRVFTHKPTDGTPGYRMGWMHGCESGMATQFSSAIMMAFYEWKKDADISVSKPDLDLVRRKYEDKWDINWNDPEEIKTNVRHYQRIFWIAHLFCRHAILGTYQLSKGAHGGSMDPPLAGEARYDPGAHSLGNIYTFHGRGTGQLTYW